MFQIKIYHDVEQSSDEWHKLRSDKISASHGSKFMVGELGRGNNYKTVTESSKSGTLGKGALTYLQTLVDGRRGVLQRTHVTTEAMANGSIREERSRELYVEKSGNEVYEVGFVECVGYNIGMSPDGLCRNVDRLVEIKNFYPEKIKKIIDTGKIPIDTFTQMQFQMLVMDYKYCDLVLTNFYDDSTDEYTCIEVERDDDFCAVLENKLKLASKWIDDKVAADEKDSMAWLLDDGDNVGYDWS